MHRSGGSVTISTKKRQAATPTVHRTTVQPTHPAGVTASPDRTVQTPQGGGTTSVTADELQLLQQAANNKVAYGKTGGIATPAGQVYHNANLAIQQKLQAMGSPYAGLVESDSANALNAQIQALAGEYNTANTPSAASAAQGGDAVGGGASAASTAAGSSSTSSTATSSTPTTFLGSIGSSISSLWSSIGSAANTVTGTTGQTRAIQWENIIIPGVVIVGIVVWAIRGFRLSVKHSGGRAA